MNIYNFSMNWVPRPFKPLLSQRKLLSILSRAGIEICSMIKVRYFGVVIVGLIVLILTFFQEKYPIKYMQVATIESSPADGPSTVVTIKDSVTNETIFLCKIKDNILLDYYKK